LARGHDVALDALRLLALVIKQRLCINFFIWRANFLTTLRSHLDITCSCYLWSSLFNVDVNYSCTHLVDTCSCYLWSNLINVDVICSYTCLDNTRFYLFVVQFIFHFFFQRTKWTRFKESLGCWQLLLALSVGQRLCINFSISRANFLTTLRSHLDFTRSCYFGSSLSNVDVNYSYYIYTYS